VATMASDLDDWIRALRQRVERGELADLDPIDIGYGTGGLPAEASIRIMLSDLEDLADVRASDLDEGSRSRRRQMLLDDFRRLREILG
jgi:hypothetical protein